MSATDGSPTKHRLEAPLERRVLLDVLAVLVERRRADARAARRARASASACWPASTAPSAAPAPTIVCSSSMNRTISPSRVCDLGEHGLEPLLELAAVLRAGERARRCRAPTTRLPFRPSGTSPRDDPLREALDDRRLADAGLADQHRVVLGPAREHLDHAPDLLVAADHRVELPRLGERPSGRGRTSRAPGRCPPGSCEVTRWPPRTSCRASRRSSSRRTTSSASSRCSTETNSSPSVVRLGRTRRRGHACERARGLRLPGRRATDRQLPRGAPRPAARSVFTAEPARSTSVRGSSWSSRAIGDARGQLGLPARRASSCAAATASAALDVSFCEVHAAPLGSGEVLRSAGRERRHAGTACGWTAAISSRSSRSERASIARSGPASSSSSRSTCWTPARLSPSSVVSRWTSRSRSTSASE